MALRTVTGESLANSIQTITVPITSGTKFAGFDSLTVSTSGADIASDIKISILDGNRERWAAVLRSAQIFGAHFNDIGNIPVVNGSLSIRTTAGGAGCIVVVSAVVLLS